MYFTVYRKRPPSAVQSQKLTSSVRYQEFFAVGANPNRCCKYVNATGNSARCRLVRKPFTVFAMSKIGAHRTRWKYPWEKYCPKS